jgi:malonyl-CoA O-methyltransferase
VARQRSEATADAGALEWHCADAGNIPLPDGSVDLVVSSLMLHWCPDLDAVFAEVRRVLRYPGVFCFATLGPESFRELRQAWAAADNGRHVMPFPELRALGDGLLRAGLGEPVLDADRFTIRYQDLRQLTGDLRDTGTTNVSGQRQRGLTGPRAWRRMAAAYAEQQDAEGRLPVTVEVLQGQAWCPDPAARPRRGSLAEVSVPLADFLPPRRPDPGH